MLQFQSLVYDIKVIIFEYVPIAERIRAERVCKEWKALVADVNSKQTALVLQAPGRRGKPDITEKERRECDNPEHFIPQNSFVKNNLRGVGDVIGIIRRLPSLKVLAWDAHFVINPEHSDSDDYDSDDDSDDKDTDDSSSDGYVENWHDKEAAKMMGIKANGFLELDKFFRLLKKGTNRGALLMAAGDYPEDYVNVGKALRKYCPGLEHIFMWSKSPGKRFKAQNELLLYKEIDNDKIKCVSYAASTHKLPYFSKLEFVQLVITEDSTAKSIIQLMRKGMKHLVAVYEAPYDDIGETFDAFKQTPSTLKFGELRLENYIYDNLNDDEDGSLEEYKEDINTKKNKALERFEITRHIHFTNSFPVEPEDY